MKTFRWDLVTPIGESVSYYWLSERDGDIGKVWASLIKVDQYFYQPIVISKDRNRHLTIKELLILNDAKEAAEKYLFDEGIIQDGDILEDNTV